MPNGQETISVVYQPIDTIFGHTYYHETLVYTNASGQQFIATSGPTVDPTGNKLFSASEGVVAASSNGISVYGTLQAKIGTPADFSPQELTRMFGPSLNSNGSDIVASGSDLSAQWSQIVATEQQINSQNLPYSPFSQNSNSMANTALTAAGISLPSDIDTLTLLPPNDNNIYWVPAGGAQLQTSASTDGNGNSVTNISDPNNNTSYSFTSAPDGSSVNASSFVGQALAATENATVNADGSQTDNVTGFNGGGSVQYTQNTTTQANGQATARITGQGDSAYLNNATVNFADNAQGMVNGSGNTINGGVNSVVSLGANLAGDFLNASNACTFDLGLGNSGIIASANNSIFNLLDGNSFTFTSGTNDTINGSNSNVSLTGGTGIAINGGNDTISDNRTTTSITFSVDGNDTITTGGSDTIQLVGSGLTETFTQDNGAGDQITASGGSTGETINLLAGANGQTLEINGATLNAAADLGFRVSATNDIINASNGDTIHFNVVDATNTIFANGATIDEDVGGATINLGAGSSGDLLSSYTSGSTFNLASGDSGINISGTNNIINATDGDSITFTDGSNDTINQSNSNISLAGGAGLVINGAGNMITDSSNGASITYSLDGDNTIAGFNAHIQLASSGLTETFAENSIGGDQVTAIGGSVNETINLLAGVGFEYVNLVDSTINLAANLLANLPGSGDIINASTGDDIRINTNSFNGANNDTIFGSNIEVDNGYNNTETVNGSNDIFTGSSGNTVNLGDNSSGDVFYFSNGNINAGSNDSFIDDGTSNTIGAESDSSVTASNDTIDFVDAGSNTGASLSGNNDNVSLQDDMSLSVAGNNNTIIDANDIVTLQGSNNSVTGSGDTLNLHSNSSGTLIGSNNLINFGNNARLIINGSGDTINATASNITSQNAVLTQSGNDLVITVANNNDKITVQNFFVSSQHQFATIEFADDVIWTGQHVAALVSGFNTAQAIINTPRPINFGNVRVGTATNEILSISNSAASPGENLDASVAGTTGSAVASGSIAALAAGATDSTDITVGINTSLAGAQSGSVALNLASDGTGIDSNGVTPLASQTVQVSGTVYREASASIAPLPSNLIVHVGDNVSQALSISNIAANDGYSENLTANVVGTTGGITTAGSTGDIAVPGTSHGITYGFSTATAGTVSGSLTLALASDGSGVDGLGFASLGQQTVAVNATINNYANAAIEEVSGGGVLTQNGNNYALTLNEGPNASPVTFDLGVLNNVTGPSDLLSGNFTTSASSAFALSGFGNFSGLTAGQADIAPTVTFNATSPGSYAETVTLHSAGSNASGYSGALGDETLAITVNVGQTYTLTNKADTISGGVGDNIILASNGTLNATDNVNGGSTGNNSLNLQGAGTFNLATPATLTNIAVINAQEGQASYNSGTISIPSTRQTVDLRDGLNAVVNVASDAAVKAQDPHAPGITIVGANNSDVINLGSGNDDVTLGSASEAVNGGGGNNIFRVKAGTIGATINGGSGNNTLDVSGGGNVIMGSNVTGIDIVNLQNAPAGQTQAAYNFTANATTGLVINDSSGNDTVTVGDVSQTVTAGAGNDTTIVNAATAGALVHGGSGTSTLEITGGGTAVMNAGDSGIDLVRLDAAINLVMNNQKIATVQGSSGNDTIGVLAGTFAASSAIDGGTGSNTLALDGAGTFDLSVPLTLANIAVITAQEGQAAYTSGAINVPNTRQTVDLRDGLNAVVNVASDASVNSQDPHAPGITIVGANNSDVINLGSGSDDVTLGSSVEIVNGGGGNNIFRTTASTIGATINGGSGSNVLDVSGGGAVTMGSNITGIAAINLLNAPAGQTQANYNFVANGTANLLITGSGGNDTITLGAASQSVVGAAGNDDIIVNAATAGALVNGGGGTNTLEIAGGGTAVMNAGDSNLNTIQLDAATNLTLNNQNSLTVQGSSGNDTIIIGGGKNDVLNSGGGYETYDVGTNIGTTIVNNAFAGGASANGEVDFLSGLSDENLWFKQSGNNLQIDLLGTSKAITISGWFGGNAGAQVESLHAGGLTLDAQVAQLVTAMASYAAAHPGFNPVTASMMPTDTTLQNAITAAWHA